MASHQHLCQHPTAAAYCHCYSPYSACHHPPPPPPPDCHPIFHPPPQPHHYSAQTHLPSLHQYHPHFQERSFLEERETQHTVSSLLRRIAALESALRSRSAAAASSNTLRDAAARTIQTHFRAFLLRRSRTLRQLKDLASIKSTLSILKSSISGKTHFDYGVVYHKVVDLLLKLDTIQGGDPMIRDGKRSIRKELNKFLDFIDGFCVEKRGFSGGVILRRMNNDVNYRVAKSETRVDNVKCGNMKSANMEKLRGLVERLDKLAEELDEEESEIIKSPDVFKKKNGFLGKKFGGSMKQLRGVQPKVKKSVSFVENGKVHKVLRRNTGPVFDENDDESSDTGGLVEVRRDLEDDLCREVEEIRVGSKEGEDDDELEAHSENGRSSDGEKDSRAYLRSEERKMYDQGEDDDFTFSAPLPLKMETRAELIDKRMKSAK
ncbi:hypothetical protein CDL12_17399 [Handroanthus impetiginosus]|uniref:BAG domain-containing protein n=1 Tax=Handroanthus impetiginosus TaxID=429701 RepID=A0A2G9GXJ4_9LAMI|nr:hypothetical protein CDL12_17399 [Handroanthus impetiginosus]